MSEDDVIKLMESSVTEEEWNSNCDEVKRQCGGYPAFWYSRVILSGLAARMSLRWR